VYHAMCLLTPPASAGTHLANPRRDGQAELDWMAGFVPRWFTYSKTVTLPGTNRARRRENMLIDITRSSAVAKRPRDASCLYSFYTLEWCGYPMVKKSNIMFIRLDMIHEREKIAVFTYRCPHFCFPWRRPCDYHAICCMDGKKIQCFQTPRSIYLSIFNSFRVIRCLSQCVTPKIAIFTTLLFPSTLNVVWMESEFDAYKLSRSMYPSIFNSFPVIRTASAKNRRFHVPQPTFLFHLETPLRLSRNILHGWKDNSMLAKPLAACTYLSSIVSELYDA